MTTAEEANGIDRILREVLHSTLVECTVQPLVNSAHFHLECAGSIEAENPTPRDIRDAFEQPDERGEHLILTHPDGSFLQVAGEDDGPFLLIHRDENAKRSYQAHQQLDRDEAERVMLDYLHGGHAWWDDYDWNEVKHTFSPAFWYGVVCLVLAGIFLLLAIIFW